MAPPRAVEPTRRGKHVWVRGEGASGTTTNAQPPRPQRKKKGTWVRGEASTASAPRTAVRGGAVAKPKGPASRRGSGARIATAKAKKPAPVGGLLCGRFLRTGKCSRRFATGASRCQRAHNPDKVAVCTKWLAGKCDDDGECTLQHRAVPERMPTCSYFLAGACSARECPYLHVNVDPAAPVCQAFLDGYCPRGLQCRNKHTMVCPNGTACPNRKACRFHHPRQRAEEGGKEDDDEDE